MNKKVILFDIDRTIFDNEKFKDLKDEQIIKLLNIKNIEEYKNIFKNYYSSLSNTRYYDHNHFIDLVCKKYNFKDKKSILSLTYDNPELYSKSLFPDVNKTLEYLVKKNKLGIFSEGKSDFQVFKFNALGLNKYFEKDLIFIVDAKDTKEVIDRLPKDVVIVDDKERICDFLFENNIDCVWLNRKDERKSDKYKTIHTLLELLDVL